MASQTAVEFGVERLRLMQFDGSGRKLRVLKVAEADMTVPVAGDVGDDLEADDIRLERIEEAAKGFTTDPSAMSYPASRTIFREFDLPFTNADQIRKVVRFESESHLPVDVDDVVVQHYVLREVRDKAHLLIAAVNKDDLLDALDLVGEVDIDPLFVDVDDFALYNALVGTGVTEEHERFVVVNAQERSTSLLFVVAGELFAVRTIRLGSHGTDGVDEVATARSHDYLQRLLREIRRTLTTLPSVGTIETVYAVGHGSRLAEFHTALGEAFGVPATEPLNLLERVDHKLSDEEVARFGPDAGVALGMAYKLAGADETRTDFRREECAYTKKFDQVKTPLITLSLLVFLAVAFFGIKSYKRMESLDRHYEYLVSAGSDQLRALYEGDNAKADATWQGAEFGKPQLRRIAGAAEDLSEELRSELGRSEKIPRLDSAMPVWIEFSRLVLENEERLGRFKIEEVDVNASTRDPSIQLTGVLESNTKLQELIDLLEAHPMVTDVDNRGSTPVGDLVRFNDMKISVDLDVALRMAQGKLRQETSS